MPSLVTRYTTWSWRSWPRHSNLDRIAVHLRMTDVVDAATRSRMMAGIGGKNTRPELLVRRELHKRGLRYKLGGAGLPGRPDIVLPKWRVAVFVHGCFWHWHGCPLSKVPRTNSDFWLAKLSANADRDIVTTISLISADWRVAIVWECALRGKRAIEQLPRRMDTLASWTQTPDSRPWLELPLSSD